MGPQCSWNMAMLLPPPRHKPKTQQVISKHLGLSQSNQPDASPQDTTSPASGLEGSLLPAVSNFVQMDRVKLPDKAGSKFPSATPGQNSQSGIPESVWSSNQKMVPQSDPVFLRSSRLCSCLSPRWLPPISFPVGSHHFPTEKGSLLL